MSWRCPNCNAESDDGVAVCWKCGTHKAENLQRTPLFRRNHNSRRYPALRAIATIYHVYAWIIGVISIGSAVYLWQELKGGALLAMAVLLAGSLSILFVIATAESIELFIDIEENTRSSTGHR